MITVMTGQVVDYFDRDFRELYAISDKLDLYKEFHVSPPTDKTATLRSKAGPKRPPLPATTSRFQVSLGDSRKGIIQVPAHKYYNPKYFLAFGDPPNPTGPPQESGAMKESVLAEVPEGTVMASSEQLDRLSPLPTEDPKEIFKKPNGDIQDKRPRPTLRQRLFKGKSSSKLSIDSEASSPSVTDTNRIDESEESVEVTVRAPTKRKSKKSSKMGQRTESTQTFNTAQDNESKSGMDKWIL